LEEAQRGEDHGSGGDDRVRAQLEGAARALHEKNYDQSLDQFEGLRHLLDEEIKAPGDSKIRVKANPMLRHVIADADRALAETPGDSVGYVRRARGRALQGDLDGALSDATKALELDPRTIAAWLIRGQIFLAQGKLEAARADVMRAIELDPTSAPA